ncbi:adenylate/guanylate cyclase domain-containing protein [Polaribacter sp. Asnod6-C07]|uniref:adenylate/guanylate cyclase domain-containing protein n=1 Tax=Polaribacter sp. Asnod6-C07 TaxID=3160582 RepID=UPI00386D73B5
MKYKFFKIKSKNIKAYLIIGFFLLFVNVVFSQNQKVSDSLKIVLQENDFNSAIKLEIIGNIAANETNTDQILIYSKQLIDLALETNSIKYVYDGYLQIGNAYRLKSDLTTALENYFKALKIAENNNLISDQGTVRIAIADVYSIAGDNKNAVQYYKQSIQLLKSSLISKEVSFLDSINLASAQLNLGDEYYNQQKLDSALIYFSESMKLFKATNYELGEAYNLGNVGLVYAKKGKNKQAETNLNKAIEVLVSNEDYYPICVYLHSISDIYIEMDETQVALPYAKSSIYWAKKYGLKGQISSGYLKLSTIYEKEKDFKKSYEYYKNHIIYRDSVNNVDIAQKIANEKAEFEIERKQTELDLSKEQNKTKNIIVFASIIALILLGFLANTLYRRNKYVVKTGKIIEAEKERSDKLLKNILPKETAEELKEKGSVKAKSFDSVSVLFTDFKGFTKFSEELSPEELVKSIDFYFSKFDEIIEKHNLEKIKTIGDAYMCAGGLPFPSKNHASNIVLAALEIVDFVKKHAKETLKLDIRVGVNTGAVVAGVVGSKKFAYDIWGDTVNVASRMESSGAINKVNISESTYNLLKDNKAFSFEFRGAIEAKGKGKVNMYFVEKLS